MEDKVQKQLEKLLDYEFTTPDFLIKAMVHRSFCAENPDAESNERMEFLGDSVLGLSVTTYIFDTYPDLSEGELSKLRASVVKADVLAEVANEIELGAALRLGKGEDASGGRLKPSILADALEALLAAVYFDGGWEAADKVVLHLFGDRIHNCSTGPGGSDFKTRLEELAAQRLEQLPRYRVDADGPDHSKHFVASVSIAGKPWGTGEGSSKKQAEQAAAQVALIALNEQLSDLSEFEKEEADA